jgi:hypothetical protein
MKAIIKPTKIHPVIQDSLRHGITRVTEMQKAIMQIETYEIEEISGDAGNMAADAEAIELAERLGLKGQQQLAKPDTLTRIPYPKLTAIQRLVFGTVFPHKTEVTDYSEGIIPLRVLQIVAYCRENSLYRRIEVWHPEPGRVDPVLIGTTRESLYHSGEDFLLARWGEALATFEQLTEQAKTKWVALKRQDLAKILRTVQADMEGLDDIANVAFLTGHDRGCYYNGLQP